MYIDSYNSKSNYLEATTNKIVGYFFANISNCSYLCTQHDT